MLLRTIQQITDTSNYSTSRQQLCKCTQDTQSCILQQATGYPALLHSCNTRTQLLSTDSTKLGSNAFHPTLTLSGGCLVLQLRALNALNRAIQGWITEDRHKEDDWEHPNTLPVLQPQYYLLFMLCWPVFNQIRPHFW